MGKEVLGFKKKDGKYISKKDMLLGFKRTDALKHGIPARGCDSWCIEKSKLVPVVSKSTYHNALRRKNIWIDNLCKKLEAHERALAKVKGEKIDAWLKKDGGLLGLSDTIIAAKVLLKAIEKMPKQNTISLESLESYCERKRVRRYDECSGMVIYTDDLLSWAKKKAKEGVKA